MVLALLPHTSNTLATNNFAACTLPSLLTVFGCLLLDWHLSYPSYYSYFATPHLDITCDMLTDPM